MESCVSLVPLMFCLYSLDNLLSCAFFISSTAPVYVLARSNRTFIGSSLTLASHRCIPRSGAHSSERYLRRFRLPVLYFASPYADPRHLGWSKTSPIRREWFTRGRHFYVLSPSVNG